MRLELTRPNGHYPLKVARLPIPPLLHSTHYAVQHRCPEQDSNLHVSQHSHLKRARLPFRHLGNIHARVHSSKERKTRLELATPTLARLCSTNWAISAVSWKLGIFCCTRWQRKFRSFCIVKFSKNVSGKRGSNSRPQPWQGCALPTELFPRFAE